MLNFRLVVLGETVLTLWNTVYNTVLIIWAFLFIWQTFLKKKNCVINIFVSPSYPKCIFAWRVGSKIRSQGVTRCTHLMSGENRWAWSCPRMVGSLRTDGKTKQKQSLSQNTPVRPICIYPEDITTSCLCSWMIKEVKTSSAVSQWLRCIKHNNVYMELYVYIWKNSCFRLF